MADGSVHFLRNPIELRILGKLGKLVTRNGGETINGNDF